MDQDFDNDLENMGDSDFLDNQEDEATEESSEDLGSYDEYSEPKKLFSKSMIIYAVALLWSFFIVFVFMYYFMYKKNHTVIPYFESEEIAEMDSTQTGQPVDSLTAVFQDSADQFAKIDTARGYYVPPEGFLSMEDHMRILKLENGRRKREIDFLWNELRSLKSQTSEIEILNQKVDSLQSVEPITIVVKDTTPNFEEERQKQLLAEKLEQERLARLAEEERLQDEALAKSAKIYSSMKPKQAANILASFDSETAAQMLMKIRERQAAKILEAMEPQKATQICKYMAQ